MISDLNFYIIAAHTLVLNNLEFDHADIYSDLGAIQQQCHYLLRTVPAKGVVILNADDPHLPAVSRKVVGHAKQRFFVTVSPLASKKTNARRVGV